MVGSVVVHNGTIIGEGYHARYGEAHAEVNAIASVKNQAILNRSTLYVSLEPCSHYGKTPPCSDHIIQMGIPEVVIACQDPFAEVNGAGIAKLRKAGVEVTIGILEQEALELNRRFVTFHSKKRPYIILKWAETADGYVDRARANGGESPLAITTDAANILVHRWRAEEAAILVGSGTAVIDNPSLTARRYSGNNPTRILLDPKLQTPPDSRIFDDSASTVVFSDSYANVNAQVVKLTDPYNLNEVMHDLHYKGIQSVLVEGGPTIHQAFYEAALWDEIRRFVSPIAIGNGVQALQLTIEPECMEHIGNDTLLTYRNR
jgi:diaminohydroxyphosphoribosylaminopyrimidine deaminase/5-amino-6-(5-phosphoribosylamino)uracil reductase